MRVTSRALSGRSRRELKSAYWTATATTKMKAAAIR